MTKLRSIPHVSVPLIARQHVRALRAARDWSLATPRRYAATATSSTAARLAARGSATAAALGAERALRDVPAYRAFASSVAQTSGRRSMDEAFALLPETTKRNYIDAFTIDERCVGGRVPARGVEVDESSGSSGKPYSWVRSEAELHEMRRGLSRLAGFLLGDDLVTINGFSMGAWATGTNVSAALAANGLLKSTGPDPEKIFTALDLLGPDRHYVITGYPPFLLDLIEQADREGFPLEKYRLSGIVGGEAMSETLRTRLGARFEVVYSAYGASDLDIGVASELPLSIWIRQRASESHELATALFGDSRRLPMLFQYDPLDYYPERNAAGELVMTVSRPSVLSPRVRYNVKDSGGALGFDAVLAVCRDFGLDPLRDAPRPAGGGHPQLPFLFVSGRSDSTVSFFGANIYPEDVEQALFADGPGIDGPDGDVEGIRGFAIELVEEADATVHPCVHIELGQRVVAHPELPSVLGERVRKRLALNSRDYRVALTEDPRAGHIEVRLHAFGAGPFAGQKEHIKRKYLVGTTPTQTNDQAIKTEGRAVGLGSLPTSHAAVLRDAMRSPSAHNAQPWRISRIDIERYELHYDHNEYLPHDPDDRDAYLTMGAFVETLVLAAPQHQLRVDVETVLHRNGADLHVATVVLRPPLPGEHVDELAAHVRSRAMNRNAYKQVPVDAALTSALAALGNVVVEPKGVAPIVAEAGARSWENRQFVADLDRWYRRDPVAEDGFTARQMHMRAIDLPSFWAARRLGRIPRPISRLFATRDVHMVRSAPALAVLGAPDAGPAAVFDAGRRLLRSWVTIAAFGYSCHPISIAIDVKDTAAKLAALAGMQHPMALYRVGRTTKAPWAASNRRPLDAVLMEASGVTQSETHVSDGLRPALLHG